MPGFKTGYDRALEAKKIGVASTHSNVEVGGYHDGFFYWFGKESLKNRHYLGRC